MVINLGRGYGTSSLWGVNSKLRYKVYSTPLPGWWLLGDEKYDGTSGSHDHAPTTMLVLL